MFDGMLHGKLIVVGCWLLLHGVVKLAQSMSLIHTNIVIIGHASQQELLYKSSLFNACRNVYIAWFEQ